MHAEQLDDIIAEQAAQQQVLMMALRRIAALARETGQDVDDLAGRWIRQGRADLDETTLRTAPSHERIVRSGAKVRMEEIITIGLR